MPMDRRQIYVVDDDEAIRHSASFMLRHAGFDVKTFADGISFLAFDPKSETACVLLDVRMPDMDGLTVLERLRTSGHTLPIIILTGHGDVSTAVTAMKSGATDFLEKPYEKKALLGALELAFSKLEKNADDRGCQQAAEARLSDLTPRERDVFERLVDGMTNKTIAQDLCISDRTVEIHRANLMSKLEADSLSAVLKVAFAAGIGISPF